MNFHLFQFTLQTIHQTKDLVYFTTRVPDTSNTSVTEVQHECYTNDTNVTECYTNDTSATRVNKFNFDNETIIFSHPYISYMANKRLQGEEQFHSKNYLLDIDCSHFKMHLKSAPQN